MISLGEFPRIVNRKDPDRSRDWEPAIWELRTEWPCMPSLRMRKLAAGGGARCQDGVGACNFIAQLFSGILIPFCLGEEGELLKDDPKNPP